MRLAGRQLPALLVILLLAAPGYYLQLSYGRHGPYPRWGQLYMQGLFALIAIAALAFVIHGARVRRAELRFRQERAEAALLKALAPDDGQVPPPR